MEIVFSMMRADLIEYVSTKVEQERCYVFCRSIGTLGRESAYGVIAMWLRELRNDYGEI